MTPEERAAAGAALLDEKIPGWRDEIQYPLDIADPAHCILGQLGRDSMGAVMKRLGMKLFDYQPTNMRKLEDLGFMGTRPYARDCAALTAEWKKLIGHD